MKAIGDDPVSAAESNTGPRVSRPARRGAARALAARAWAAALLSLPLLLAACGGGDNDNGNGNGNGNDIVVDGAATTTAPAPALASITLSPGDVKVGVGLSQTVAAQARDQNGAVLAGIGLTWTSSDPRIATVDKGIVTGVGAGTASMTASSGGVVSNPVGLTVVAVSKGSVVVDKAWVFMTASGQSAQLSAQILDAQGAPSPGSVSWSSSAPDKVSVDAAGRLIALSVGSAAIVAEAGGVRSAPTLAIVAAPQPGALLVTDAQVVAVGPVLGLAAGAVAGVGSRYEVTLQNVAAPLAGTVVLAAESAPLAGKVVSSRQDPAGLVVTLQIVALPQLFSAYDIRLDIELAGFGMEALPDRSAATSIGPVWSQAQRRTALALTTKRPLDAFDPFKAWKCDASIKPQLVSAPISLSLENSLHLVLEDRPGYSKHALEGSAAIVGSAGLKLKAGFKANARCDAQGQIRLPVFGWFSAIAMPAVRFGLGAELAGEITLVQSELSVEGRLGIAPVLGWKCGGASPDCRALDTLGLTDSLKTKSQLPSKNGMQAKVSAQFYVIAGLDASILLGAINAGLVEGRIGPKQSFDLAFEEDQAARDDYASSYDLKLDGVVEPGPALKKAIELAIGDESTTVSFSAKFSSDISESPKGTFSVNKAKVRPGTAVDFTVDLTPTSSLTYWQLGYNVTGLQLYRRREGEAEFTPWKSMNQVASNRATYHWVPTEADAGKYEIAAFVNTQVLTPLLEVEANSVREVEVSCFAASTQAPGSEGRATILAAPLAASCVDSFAGTDTYVAKTPGLPSTNVKTEANITWTADPTLSSPTQTTYNATGSFSVAFNHADGCVSTLSPSSFTIVDDPSTPTRLTIFQDGVNHASYGFGAAQLIDTTVTRSCPGSADVVTPLRGFQMIFASGSGSYTPGQATLAGSSDDAATTTSWRFDRP